MCRPTVPACNGAVTVPAAKSTVTEPVPAIPTKVPVTVAKEICVHMRSLCGQCHGLVSNAGLPGLEPVVLTASLKHHFEAVGGNIVQITFEDTEVKLTGGIGGLLVGGPVFTACMLCVTLPCWYSR